MIRSPDRSAIFEGAAWFHVSGVTPAISACAAELTLEAVCAARRAGATVSCDYNFRKNLWRYGKKAPEVMRELVRTGRRGLRDRQARVQPDQPMVVQVLTSTSVTEIEPFDIEAEVGAVAQ